MRRIGLWLLVPSTALLTAASLVVVFGQGVSKESCMDLPHGTMARDCYETDLMPDSLDALPDMFLRATELLSSSDAGGHFSIECHEVMHNLGYAVEKKYGPVDLSATPTETCSVGFQHGVAEFRLAKLSDSDLAAAGPTWCSGQDMAICRHLLGHVGMRRSLEKSGTIDIKYVSDVCDYPLTIEKDERSNALEEFRCLDGAYMEWTLWSMRVDPSAAPSAPEDACDAARRYSLVASSACLSQVGTLMYGVYPSQDATMEACFTRFSKYGPDASRLCVYSVVNVVASFSEDPVAAAASLCKGDYSYDCGVGFVRSAAANLGDSEVQRLCSSILPGAKDECARDASGPYPFEFDDTKLTPKALEPVEAEVPAPDQDGA